MYNNISNLNGLLNKFTRQHKTIDNFECIKWFLGTRRFGRIRAPTGRHLDRFELDSF